MQIDLPNFMLAASVAQAVMLSVLMLFQAGLGRVSNWLLVVVLLSIAAGYTEILMFSTGITLQNPNYAYIGTLLSILQPPAIYLYTKSLMYRNFSMKPRYLIHLLPFLVSIILFFISYYLQPIDVKKQMLLGQDIPGMPTSLSLALIVHGVFLSYLICSISSLMKFSAGVKNVFSNIDSVKMSWLKILLFGYVFIWLASLIYCLAFYVFKCSTKMDYVIIVYATSAFIFVNMLAMHAMKQSVIFSGLTNDEVELINVPEVDSNNVKITDEQKQQIKDFMAVEKPFLDSNLSLNKLAKQIGLAPRNLSLVINHGFDKNFFDFIGEYRIKYAMELLEKNKDGRSILDIMYESGFNSKSVFNTAFKIKTGMTPTQYRNRELRHDS